MKNETKATVAKTNAKKPAPAAKKAAAKKATKKVAAKKVLKRKTVAKKTTIEAGIDVGFGNALFVRGDAPGLSWSKGVPMDCQGTDNWSIAIAGVKEPFEYKVLVNDIQWSVGSNFIASAGKPNAVTPAF